MTISSPFDRLREERLRLGLTQVELAEACAVQRETWSRYEAGRMSPGMDVLVALLQRGFDIPYLLSGSRSFEPPPPLTSREAVLLDNYRRAGDTGRRTIESTAAAFAAGSGEPARGTHQVIHGKVGQVAGRDVRNVKVKKASR